MRSSYLQFPPITTVSPLALTWQGGLLNNHLNKSIYCLFTIFISMDRNRKQQSKRAQSKKHRTGSHYSRSDKTKRAAKLAEARRKKAAIGGQNVPEPVIYGGQEPASPIVHEIPEVADQATPVAALATPVAVFTGQNTGPMPGVAH